METKNLTETKEVAQKLVTWFNQGDMNKCYQELYSPEIVSIETGDDSEMGHLEGMEAVQKKGEWWQNTFEVHSSNVSEPQIADNYFSVRYDMDTTHKPSGQRSETSEIGVYKVENGKIVREQFFYDR
ncbi:MAG: nuclear transport factor 2 family protein [Flavobacteriaceae bacterium]|nr:nuclear transport factor 2 family protein [Flavobacteriaceae bacterium]